MQQNSILPAVQGADDHVAPVTTKTRYAPKRPLWRALSFFTIRCLLTPVAHLWCRVILGKQIVGRRKLRGYRRSGYFLFGELSAVQHDHLTTLLISNPKHIYRVVPGKIKNGRTEISARRQICGDIPTPATEDDVRAFLEAVEKRTVQRGVVTLPTSLPVQMVDIAPFCLPARFDEPSFCFTTVREPNKRGRLRTITYIDGPFYPTYGLPLPAQEEELRTAILSAIEARKTTPTSPARQNETETNA